MSALLQALQEVLEQHPEVSLRSAGRRRWIAAAASVGLLVIALAFAPRARSRGGAHLPGTMPAALAERTAVPPASGPAVSMVKPGDRVQEAPPSLGRRAPARSGPGQRRSLSIRMRAPGRERPSMSPSSAAEVPAVAAPADLARYGYRLKDPFAAHGP
jgi:hypothetical protein